MTKLTFDLDNYTPGDQEKIKELFDKRCYTVNGQVGVFMDLVKEFKKVRRLYDHDKTRY